VRFSTFSPFPNTAGQRPPTGKIVAMPNPPPAAEDSAVVISWGTNDPNGAEIRVSTSGAAEKLVTRGGQSGEVEIGWVQVSTEYEFRLYGSSHPKKRLDAVKVQRRVGSWQSVLRELAGQIARQDIDVTEVSEFIAKAMRHCLKSPDFHRIFALWERRGFHVTPAHFYEPIPKLQALPDSIWKRPSELFGVDMNESGQLQLLRNEFPKFRHEYEQIPTSPPEEPGRFYLNNGLFDGVDALVAYCILRHFQPRLIIEVGSGFSSLLTAEAVARGNKSELICIEPFPREFLRQGFPGLRSLIEKNVQDVDLAFFAQLEMGDVLFIDSSHTVKTGGDVNYLFLEVLPRLNPGVIVHVHDIFLPFEYRRDWVMDQLRFWTEQYLLQAFLMFNSEFEVLLGSNYLAHYHRQDLISTFAHLQEWSGGSFWMRRRRIKNPPNQNHART
jgi:hypothetical protein